MDQFSEKRTLERFNIHCTGVIAKDDEEIDIEVINVSGQGMGFHTSKLLEDNEKLLIRLKVKDVPEPLTVTGKVIWQKGVDPYTYRVGFKLDMTSWVKVGQILDQ